MGVSNTSIKFAGIKLSWVCTVCEKETEVGHTTNIVCPKVLDRWSERVTLYDMMHRLSYYTICDTCLDCNKDRILWEEFYIDKSDKRPEGGLGCNQE